MIGKIRKILEKFSYEVSGTFAMDNAMSEINEILKELEKLVIDDVPYQYQNRLQQKIKEMKGG